MVALQTACIVIAGCVVASLMSVFLIRCAIKLFKRTEDAMHWYMACMTSADLLLAGKRFRPHRMKDSPVEKSMGGQSDLSSTAL